MLKNVCKPEVSVRDLTLFNFMDFFTMLDLSRHGSSEPWLITPLAMGNEYQKEKLYEKVVNE